MDRIRLVNMAFYGYHGVSVAEKETGRRFEVDCEINADLSQAGKSDELIDTIDYANIYKLVADIVQNRSFSLLEGLAAFLANEILNEFPVIEVTIKVRKLVPPINGNIDYIEVEVTRRQTSPEKLIASEENNE
ncbi:MAG: dihydroneopterin aldolase [candidate division Zixibacteria bacterium]|nr:dihydroneopterin aldolase [candidate division Zixibacteria bacterium]